jgi:hypothetical protein
MDRVIFKNLIDRDPDIRANIRVLKDSAGLTVHNAYQIADPEVQCHIQCARFFLTWRNSSPPLGQGLLIVKDSLSHSDAPQSVGLLWTGNQLVAETSTRQHTTLTTNIHVRSEIRTRNLSRLAAADPRLRPRGHWDGRMR